MTDVKDLMFPSGTYVKDGQEKTRWLKVGALFTREDGKQSIKLEAIPTGRNEKGELWLSAFSKTRTDAPPGSNQTDGNIPF